MAEKTSEDATFDRIKKKLNELAEWQRDRVILAMIVIYSVKVTECGYKKFDPKPSAEGHGFGECRDILMAVMKSLDASTFRSRIKIIRSLSSWYEVSLGIPLPTETSAANNTVAAAAPQISAADQGLGSGLEDGDTLDGDEPDAPADEIDAELGSDNEIDPFSGSVSDDDDDSLDPFAV